MNQTNLPGLVGSTPLGALAAFGLLRWCHARGVFGSVRLSWKFEGDWIAVLHTGTSVTPQEFVECLIDSMKGCSEEPHINRPKHPLHHEIKMAPEVFRELLVDTVGQSSRQTRESLDFLCSYGSEFVTARSTGEVKPTFFHMTAGRQLFMSSVRELAESLDPKIRTSRKRTESQRRHEIADSLREALFGPWQYQDPFHALGWDPETEALYAFKAIAPGDTKPTSVRAAVWLAFQSLALFPCVPDGSRLHVTAFSKRGDQFTWPIWETACSVDSLRSLLSSEELTKPESHTARLAAAGVRVVFRCRRDVDGNGRGQFKPSVLCPKSPT